MSIFIPFIIMSFATRSFSESPLSLNISSISTHALFRPTITRPQNRSRRLQSNSVQDAELTNDFSTPQHNSYASTGLGTNSWTNYDAHRRAALTQTDTQTKSNFISKFGVTPKSHVTYLRNADDVTYPKPEVANYKLEVPILRPEVKRFYTHGGDDFQNVDSYDVNYDGSNDHHIDNEHNSYEHHRPVAHNHPPPSRPIYVAVKTHGDEDTISKLGLLAILKLILAKFKTFWLIKFGLFLLFLIKIPVIIFKIALKFLFLLKFAKLFKLILIPSLIPLILLPLLPLVLLLLPVLLLPLAPLLLIPVLLPLLIPLLLLLPVPIFSQHHPRPTYEYPPPPPPHPTEGPEPDEERARRSIERTPSIQTMEDLVFLTRRVMDSQQCMEKLACDIGGNQTPRMFSLTIIRVLEMFQTFAPQKILERLRSYTNAYKLGARRGRECAAEFLCTPVPGLMNNVNIIM